MQYIQLNNGIEMPALGFGTHLINDQDVEEIVVNAIKAGYRHIDTAQVYGNERGVGRAIKRCIDASIVKRDDLFITTKTPWLRPGYDETLEGFEESLKKLGLDYIDLYLVHHSFGNFSNQLILLANTARALEKLYKEGRIRSFGVSNFNERDIHFFIKELGVMPAINQIEFHPFLKQKRLSKYCNEKEIKILS